MNRPQISGHLPSESPPRTLPVGSGLTNATMAVYASKIQTRTGLRVDRVRLAPDALARPGDAVGLGDAQHELLRRMRSGNVHAVLAYVDTLRRRYRLEVLQLVDPKCQLMVAVHRDGRLTVTPQDQYERVKAKLIDCLQS